MEVTQGLYKKFYVVVLARHEVPASEVYPFQAREPGGELINNMYERAREGLGGTLTVAVDVEALDRGGEHFGQGEVAGEDTKAGAWGAGVV